jgi:hypothetical protein
MGLLALGMACVAFGASGIEAEKKTVKYDLVDSSVPVSYNG